MSDIKLTWEPQRVLDWLTENAQTVLHDAAEYCLIRYLTYAPVDTGYMIGTAEILPGADDFSIRVVVTAPYSPYVEFGHFSRAGNWVSPNPALRNAVGDTATTFPQIAAKVFRT